MYEDIGQRDRRSAVLLLAFVVVQAAYLVINIGVIRPPAPEAPIEDVRATVIAHAGTIRWLTLLALTSFFGLFLPGVYGLRERMHATHRGRDLVAAGALSIIMSVVLVVTVLGVLGLVPTAELSDSVLRMLLMVDTFSAWVFGNFAGALFLVAASTALLGDERPPRWLIRGGFTAAGAGLLGSLWVVDGNTDGPLFGIGVLSRAMFLAWVAAAGIWLHRTAVSADSAPDRVAAVPTA